MIYLDTASYTNNIKRYRNNHSELFSVTVMNKELDKKDIEIIRAIDKAEYIGNNNMIDRFGNVTSIKNISTGAKVVLNIKWFIENDKADTPINITSCGDSALVELIDVVKNKDVHLLTCNYTTMCDKESKIIVNNKYEISSFSELDTLEEKLYETSN